MIRLLFKGKSKVDDDKDDKHDIEMGSSIRVRQRIGVPATPEMSRYTHALPAQPQLAYLQPHPQQQQQLQPHQKQQQQQQQSPLLPQLQQQQQPDPPIPAAPPPLGGLRNSQAIVRPAMLVPIPPFSASHPPPIAPSGHTALPSYPATMLHLHMEDVTLHTQIGGGAFGQVWLGTWKATPVAVKVLSPSCALPEQALRAFHDEVGMLEKLRHPNICLFIGAVLQLPTRAIVTELVARGSVWDSLRRGLFPVDPASTFWPSWAIKRVVEGTCRGLLYLHSHSPSIIHRDLKSANILLEENFCVKICDFGLARLRAAGSSAMTSGVGTFQWMAPEVLVGGDYDTSVDIYSLGVCCWEVMTGQCPYENSSQVDLILNVVKGGRPEMHPAFTEKQRKLLGACWHADPAQRCGLPEILASLESVFL